MDEQPDRGGPSDRVKIDGAWEDVIERALDREKPPERVAWRTWKTIRMERASRTI